MQGSRERLGPSPFATDESKSVRRPPPSPDGRPRLLIPGSMRNCEMPNQNGSYNKNKYHNKYRFLKI